MTITLNLKPLVIWAFILLFGLLFVRAMYSDLTEEIDNEYREQIEEKMAGIWLRDHKETEYPKIMTRKGFVCYYSNSYKDGDHCVGIPYENYSTLIDFAHAQNVTYLVISKRYIDRRPIILDLLNEENHPADLEPLYVDDRNEQYKIIIYKLFELELTTEIYCQT